MKLLSKIHDMSGRLIEIFHSSANPKKPFSKHEFTLSFRYCFLSVSMLAVATLLGGIENVVRRFFYLFIYDLFIYSFMLEVMTLLRGVERVLSRDFFNLGGESGSGKL